MARDRVGPKLELIAFERMTSTPDGLGGFSTIWQPIGEAYAAISYKGGGESVRQGAVRSTIKYSFVCWESEVRALGVTQADRISYNGEFWNIRELDGGRGGVADAEIIAEAGVSQ